MLESEFLNEKSQFYLDSSYFINMRDLLAKLNEND